MSVIRNEEPSRAVGLTSGGACPFRNFANLVSMLLLVYEYIFLAWPDELTMLEALRVDFFGTILPILPVPELWSTDPPALLLLEAYAFTLAGLVGFSDVDDLAEREARLAAQPPRCSTG